jgi:hypothetical protein
MGEALLTQVASNKQNQKCGSLAVGFPSKKVRHPMALVRQLADVVDSVSELFSRHVDLARAELADDARFVGVRVGVIAALAPLVLVGYGFLCVALALALRSSLGDVGAFAFVGLLNVIPGVVGIGFAGRQLGKKKVLATSLTELDATTGLVRREKS